MILAICKSLVLASTLLSVTRPVQGDTAPATQPTDSVAILPTLVPDVFLPSSQATAPAKPASKPASAPASLPASTAPNWMTEMGEPGEFTKTILPLLLLRKPELGLRVTELPGEIREILGTRFDWGKGVASGGGLLVSRILEKSDALAVGVVEGDILTGIDFGEGGIQPLGSLEDLELAMEQIEPGEVVRLTLFRRGQIAKADVQVGEWDSVLEPVARNARSRFEEPWIPLDRQVLEIERLECLKAWRLKKDVLALKDRADLTLLCGDFTRAAEDYRELIEAWPKEPKPWPAWLGRCHALRKSAKISEATAAAESMLKLQPDNYWAYLELTRCAITQGKSDEAVRQLKKAWTRIPANDFSGQDEALALWMAPHISLEK